jgi:ligand-binding sensor domain-containing protein
MQSSRGNKHIRYDNRTGLLSNGIFQLSKIDDEIWVGTYGGGLSILNTKTKRWRHYNIPNGLGDAFVYDILRTRSGDIWIATWSGANRIVGGNLDSIESWELYTVGNTSGGLPNDWVYGLAEGKSGEIWLATEGGLARFENGTWSNWDHADGLGAPYDAVSGNIKYQNDPGQYSAHHARQKKEQGLGDIMVAYNPNYIISLVVDNDGVVWAGTWGAGLSRFDGERWQNFTTSDGLPGNHVFALAGGADRDIWIGTSSGLAKYDGIDFTKFGEMDGLYSDTVFSIDVASDGGIWVGGLGGGTWFPRGIENHGVIQ